MNVSSVSIILDVWEPKPPRTAEQRFLDTYSLDRVVLPVKLLPKEERGVLDRVVEFFNQLLPSKMQEKLTYTGKLGKKGLKLARQVKDFAMPLFDEFHYFSELFDHSVTAFLQGVRKTKILGALSIFGTAKSLSLEAQDLVKSCKKSDVGGVIEAELGIAENLADVTSAADTVIGGLVELGAVQTSAEIALASTALGVIGMVLSTATIALNSKQWYDSAKFRYELAKSEKANEFVARQSKRELEKRLGVSDGGLFKLQVEAIWKKHADEPSAETQAATETVQEAMKKRLISKEICHALKILSAVVTLVAGLVFLFTPLAPVGFGLLALGTAITIAIMITDHVLDYKFNKLVISQVPKEEKYTAEIQRYEWEKRGKKAFHRKTRRIRFWKPTTSTQRT